jgi:hypothetical protein
MNTATNKLITIIAADDQMTKAMDAIAAVAQNKLGQVGGAGIGATSLLSFAFRAVAKVAGVVFHYIATAAAVAFAAATAASEEWFRRSIKGALELQGSYVALAMVGKSLGIPGSALEAKVQELRKIGIEWGAATTSLTFWLQAGLPLDKISGMARAAQDTAKAFGKISSDVFQEFVEAIQAGQLERLRGYGLYAPLEQTIKQYAPAQYKNTNPIDLPQQVRQQALMAYLMDKTQIFTGAYETTLERAAGLWASMVRHVQEVEKFFGILGLGALFDMLVWATKFVEKIKEMTKEGHGLAAPMIFVSSIIRAFVGGFGNAEQAAMKVSIWMDKTFSAENAGKAATLIMKAVAGFYLMLSILKSIAIVVLEIAQARMLDPFAIALLGPKRWWQTLKDIEKLQWKLFKSGGGDIGNAQANWDKANAVGKKAKGEYGDATEAARKAMAELIKVMGYQTNSINNNTAALNAANEKVKQFGGGERFQRYGSMLSQPHGAINVHVHGSASYQQGAMDMGSALGDAMSKRLAGAMGPGLSGAGA